LTGTWGQPWRRVGVTDIHSAIIVAGAEAQRAADAAEKVVIAPPTATFKPGFSATEADICEGPCLSIEVDRASPSMARIKLAEVLGQPTVVVHSGGVYVGPNGAEDRLHLHWRLKEPTRTQEDHATLKECRRLATLIAQGDGSAVPLVHPLRSPGSWHRKDEPKLVWGEYAADREIELADALELLRAAAPADIKAETPHQPSQSQSPADITDVISAVAQIPNDNLDWHEWKSIVMAIWSATGGSPAGLAAAMAFSAKSAKDDAGGTMAAWKEIAGCPPDRIGVGTLFIWRRTRTPAGLGRRSKPNAMPAGRNRQRTGMARRMMSRSCQMSRRQSHWTPRKHCSMSWRGWSWASFTGACPMPSNSWDGARRSSNRASRKSAGSKAAEKERTAREQAARKAEKEQRKAAAEKAKTGGLSLDVGSDVDLADRVSPTALRVHGLPVTNSNSLSCIKGSRQKPSKET
jgi:hypothetical protein